MKNSSYKIDTKIHPLVSRIKNPLFVRSHFLLPQREKIASFMPQTNPGSPLILGCILIAYILKVMKAFGPLFATLVQCIFCILKKCASKSAFQNTI